MSPTHYTSIIIGSGQAGTPLATHLKTQLSHTVCLIERAHIGGCCVNEGCTPTKTMIASGRVAHLARRAADYGIDIGNEDVKVDMKRVRERKREIVKRFREGGERRLEEAGVDVLRGEARFVGGKEVVVELSDGSGEEKRVSADFIFINTGERPSRPPLAGLEEVEREAEGRVLDSSSVQELGEVPEHLVVLGGGYIGLEFGQLFRRLGARVTIIQRGAQLLPREDEDVAECMLEILKGDGIDIFLNTSAISVSTSSNSTSGSTTISLKIASKDGTASTITSSHLLLATGRTPNTSTLNLPAAGIKTSSHGHIPVSPTLETNIPGIYTLGDVHGGPAFTHISYDDFRIIRDNFSPSAQKSPQKSLHTTHQRAALTPYTIYTDPQLAHVGLHPSSLPASTKALTASIPLTWVARALETDETRGMLKATVDRETGLILGFSAIAPEAGELMAVVQMAMVGGVRWEGLREAVFAHPSWSEGLNNLWGELREVGG